MAQITLASKLEDIFRLTPMQKKGLEKLSLKTAEDLLRYAPTRYLTKAKLVSVSEIKHGETVAVEGKLGSLDYKKTWRKKINIAEAKLRDTTGSLTAVWYHQPYMARMLKNGSLARLQGKASVKGNKIILSNPQYETIPRLSYRGGSNAAAPVPIYHETRGISSRWLQFHIAKLFELLGPYELEDPVPGAILKKYHLPKLYSAFRALHFPKTDSETVAARKRMSFDEIFFIQLARQKDKIAACKSDAIPLAIPKKDLNSFISRLPFKLTKTQKNILGTIAENLGKNRPMARLLEGDVGSGKTVIAAAACYITARAGYQATYMAPTEILAKQHFEAFSKLLGSSSCKIGYLTSAEARVYPSKAFAGTSAHISKPQLLKWIDSGEIKILIGTHALTAERVKFRRLAFIVVDEQHRFGIAQRRKLSRRKSREHDKTPHFLSMTATPIPRTLALTIFGDLDLSVLDELPPGRSPIETRVLVQPRERSWDIVKREIESGHQCFVICPRINKAEDGKAEQKSVTEEYKKISELTFPEFKSAMLHGKMTPREKDRTMKAFADGSAKILVATSLIEVGIDMPNATLMIVEGADRFGLAQLHQLRGRIGRGKHKSYFIAVTDSKSESARNRLAALARAKNGFELAEIDLELRGPGELAGKNQWGMSDLGMEALKNIKMVEAAREEARALLLEDHELAAHAALSEKLKARADGPLHFE